MDLTPVVNLGIGGLSIYIMWKMYESNTRERAKYFEALRTLEADIRNKFSTQLMENTNATREHSKVMESVVKILDKLTK